MSIYLHRNGQQEGPYTQDEILLRIRSGTVSFQDLAWKEGEQDWKPVSTFLQLPPAKPTSRSRSLHDIVVIVLAVGGALWMVIAGLLNAGSKLLAAPEVRLAVSDVEADWYGGTGGGYFPQVSLTVRNTGEGDITFTRLRAVFLDEKGVITGEDQEAITNLPAGRSKGPVSLRGTVGFTNDIGMYPMMKDKNERWRYELYKEAGVGKWTKIKSGPVIPDGAYDE